LLTNSPYYFVDGGMRFMLEVFDRKETISCILCSGVITYLVSIVIKLFLPILKKSPFSVVSTHISF